MPILLPYSTSLGYCQVTPSGTAVGLAQGYSTTATVAVGNSGGSGYSDGDIVTIGGTGTQAIFYVLQVNSTGGVTLIGYQPKRGANPVSGMYLSAGTPGATNVAAVNVSVRNAAATGLTLNVTYVANVPPMNCQGAIIQASSIGGQAILWRDDGVAPTTTVGMIINSGDSWPYTGNPSNPLIIGATTAAICNVNFIGTIGNPAIGR